MEIDLIMQRYGDAVRRRVEGNMYLGLYQIHSVCDIAKVHV